MSGTKKKRVDYPENEEMRDVESVSSGDDTGDDDSDQEHIDEVIQVDFEAHEPNGEDFEGIKRLLQQLILKAHVDTSALSDLIIQQNYVGNVIKQTINPEDSDDEGDDDIFGITTVLNLTDRQEQPCIQQLKKLLLDQCHKYGSQECIHIMNQLLERKKTDEFHVGFLVNERLVNIPAKISGPAFESLFKDIQDGVKRNQRLKFDYYILISKTYKLTTNEKKGKGHVETNVYPKPEEEFFKNAATVWLEYSISGSADSGLQGEWDADDEGMTPFHQVVIIQSSKLESIISQIKAMA